MTKTNQRIYNALFAWKFATYDHKKIEYLNACMYSMKSASTNGLRVRDKKDVLYVVTKKERDFKDFWWGVECCFKKINDYIPGY